MAKSKPPKSGPAPGRKRANRYTLNIPMNPAEHRRVCRAAGEEGKSPIEFARDVLNAVAADIWFEPLADVERKAKP